MGAILEKLLPKSFALVSVYQFRQPQISSRKAMMDCSAHWASLLCSGLVFVVIAVCLFLYCILLAIGPINLKTCLASEFCTTCSYFFQYIADASCAMCFTGIVYLYQRMCMHIYLNPSIELYETKGSIVLKCKEYLLIVIPARARIS